MDYCKNRLSGIHVDVSSLSNTNTCIFNKQNRKCNFDILILLSKHTFLAMPGWHVTIYKPQQQLTTWVSKDVSIFCFVNLFIYI